jgi:hypothetical protein
MLVVAQVSNPVNVQVVTIAAIRMRTRREGPSVRRGASVDRQDDNRCKSSRIVSGNCGSDDDRSTLMGMNGISLISAGQGQPRLLKHAERAF